MDAREAAGEDRPLDRMAAPDGEAVEEARRQFAQDGHAVVPGPDDALPHALRACRTQVLTALPASQERSRTAGLAQRPGGDVAGYDAMRPRSQA